MKKMQTQEASLASCQNVPVPYATATKTLWVVVQKHKYSHKQVTQVEALLAVPKQMSPTHTKLYLVDAYTALSVWPSVLRPRKEKDGHVYAVEKS